MRFCEIITTAIMILATYGWQFVGDAALVCNWEQGAVARLRSATLECCVKTSPSMMSRRPMVGAWDRLAIHKSARLLTHGHWGWNQNREVELRPELRNSSCI